MIRASSASALVTPPLLAPSSSTKNLANSSTFLSKTGLGKNSEEKENLSSLSHNNKSREDTVQKQPHGQAVKYGELIVLGV